MNVGPSRTAPALGSLDVVLPARLPLARPYPGVRERSSSLPRARTMPRREVQRTSSEKLGTRGGQGFRSSTFDSRSTSGRPLLRRSESALSCPRRLVRVWNCPRCRPRQWLGALPLARRLPISDFRSCFSCSDSQTRTPRGDANSFRLSDCLQPWGQGTSWWVPPNKCFAGDAVVRLEVFRFAPLTTPCHGNLETPTIHAHSWRA